MLSVRIGGAALTGIFTAETSQAFPRSSSLDLQELTETQSLSCSRITHGSSLD